MHQVGPHPGKRQPDWHWSEIQRSEIHRILNILLNILPDGQAPVVLAEEGAGLTILLPRRHLVCASYSDSTSGSAAVVISILI